MRCPYCRTEVTWGLTACPKCHARISYGCTVPITGSFLAIVIAFLMTSALVPIFSVKDAAGNVSISSAALAGIAAFSLLLAFGLWLLMARIARRFVSFHRSRTGQ